ncbi:hypothetical protein N7478_001721 [Penicillium angulare]|uniref:uncharacterized protein n=1 Tax=Penicillium angulare TaxID=116970 RepID=UPI00253FABCD|nr:uncharacterized protein N7478_001721 [Penicillium angulare]KAJ5288691.1 hypothetical protein N7478_001721 [Penicillium angulare]
MAANGSASSKSTSPVASSVSAKRRRKNVILDELKIGINDLAAHQAIDDYCYKIFLEIIVLRDYQEKYFDRGEKQRKALEVVFQTYSDELPDVVEKIIPTTLLPRLVQYFRMSLEKMKEKKAAEDANGASITPFTMVPNADIQIIRGNKPFCPYLIRLSDLCCDLDKDRSIDTDWVNLAGEHKFDELLKQQSVDPKNDEVWWTPRSLGEVLLHYKDNKPDLNNKPWIIESLIDSFNYRSTVKRTMQARYPEGHELWSGDNSLGRLERPSFTMIIRRKGATGDVINHKKQPPVTLPSSGTLKRTNSGALKVLEYTPTALEKEEVPELDEKKAWVNIKYKKQKKSKDNNKGDEESDK